MGEQYMWAEPDAKLSSGRRNCERKRSCASLVIGFALDDGPRYIRWSQAAPATWPKCCAPGAQGNCKHWVR